ncbi:helix-turn-helix transcriptional regulator, partial [Mycobacterium sp. 852002-10029_SCH5224772]|uniref:helix-turn-helix transcriptional regulator n=1 Tax=Mycobacterium sp. 852002-10029_SCH5224772 TaxID=1834083 RepID=UPI000AE5040F
LRLPAHTQHSTQRRVAENRQALELSDISDVTRARHLAWLAYNLALQDQGTQRRTAADEAAAAAAVTDDVEATIMAGLALALLDAGEGYPGGAVGRLEELCPLVHPDDAALAHAYAAMHYANLLAVIGRLDDATARVTHGTGQARREGNAMALAVWAVFSGIIHLAAGRLSAALDAAEPLPPPQPTGASEPDILRTVILAKVAVHTDDRNMLQQTITQALDAYSTGSPAIRRGAAYVLALAAWQRDDVHEAVRWLGGDIALLGTPLQSYALDRLILGARVASAAGDAGLRVRVLQATEMLESEQPAVPLLAGVAAYARAILERDAPALVAVTDVLRASSRPLLYASAAEDAGGELSHAQRNAEAVKQLNASFDAYIECEALADARRVGRALRRLGVERRIVTRPRAKTGWDSLTDSEHTVVRLIAEGATNRWVAQQLHLSPHTVKTHVHNAFAKLGVTSRAQLAQLMRGA